MTGGPIPFVLGATGTGKTTLAIALARRLDGEIVSADSRQAYRGLEVGTAAPTPAERAAVPHHGVGFLDPGERYGAGRFATLARGWIEGIRARGRSPIVAGGTGLFVRALLAPLFREPELDADRRRRLGAWLARRETVELADWAARLDPAFAARLGVVDRQRAGRGVEIALLTGRPLSWWHAHAPGDGPIPARSFVLELPPGEHRTRLAERVRAVLAGGWPEEVRGLLAAGYGEGSPAWNALGYREVAALVRGEIGEAEAEERIERATWRYARRQRTWLRTQLPGEAVPLDARLSVDQLAAIVEANLRENEEGPAA